MSKRIYLLNSGVWITVSDVDFLPTLNLKLHVSKDNFGRKMIRIGSPPELQGQYLHLWIAKRAGMDLSNTVDHHDCDYTNNDRENLRPATRCEQNRNRNKQKRGRSGFKGVSPQDGRWRSDITPDGKHTFLGMFDTEKEAALAYDEAARKYFGKFARLNFPREGEQQA